MVVVQEIIQVEMVDLVVVQEEIWELVIQVLGDHRLGKVVVAQMPTHPLLVGDIVVDILLIPLGVVLVLVVVLAVSVVMDLVVLVDLKLVVMVVLD